MIEEVSDVVLPVWQDLKLVQPIFLEFKKVNKVNLLFDDYFLLRQGIIQVDPINEHDYFDFELLEVDYALGEIARQQVVVHH